MTTKLNPETADDLRSFVEREVAVGFRSSGAIVEAAVRFLDGEADELVLAEEAGLLCQLLIAEHEQRQRSWPPITDCDKLDRAFFDLESRGVVSRQDFTCCGTCGVGEIHGEMERAKADGRHVKGYAFYHQQDTESAADGCGLHLNYGSADGTEAGAVAIGHLVVETLQANGLRPEWDGSLSKRISVPLDWKRRRA